MCGGVCVCVNNPSICEASSISITCFRPGYATEQTLSQKPSDLGCI